MTTVISVNNLGKKYTLHHQHRERYKSLRESIVNNVKSIGRLHRQVSNHKDDFWALKGLNFEIQRGDKVGIIGRNGAGKSTLLKILSRITEPTTGSIKINGRIASLLEVGTGFHPELTGYENIYLNGAIMGMTRAEIKEKFDEIVDFAEVEKFLDTPVKRYSSGMYMRLAFSVAAHLEPEILIVDEVLAVGDAEFQKKCLGKMQQVGNSGRTVLFVSHTMSAVQQLCDKAILLERGQIKKISSDINDVIKMYISHGSFGDHLASWANADSEYESEYFSPTKLMVVDLDGKVSNSLSKLSEGFVLISGYINKLDSALQVGYAIYDESDNLLYWSCHNDTGVEFWPTLNKGLVNLRSRIPTEFLSEGRYRLELLTALYRRQWLCEPNVNSPSIMFEILGGIDSPYNTGRRPGLLSPIIKWEAL